MILCTNQLKPDDRIKTVITDYSLAQIASPTVKKIHSLGVKKLWTHKYEKSMSDSKGGVLQGRAMYQPIIFSKKMKPCF